MLSAIGSAGVGSPPARGRPPRGGCALLDGAWYGQGGELCWEGLGHFKTSEVGAVLEIAIRCIERHLCHATFSGLMRWTSALMA